MPGVVTVNIKGLDELQKKLEEVPRKISRRILKTALKNAAKLMIQAMAAMAPKDTGFLAEHFGMRIKLERGDIAGSAFVGPEGKIDYPNEDGGYRQKVSAKGKHFNIGRIPVVAVARFLEFGTRFMTKRPFMTQAFETTKERALNTIIEEIKTALEQETK